jgi:hypothetical protein
LLEKYPDYNNVFHFVGDLRGNKDVIGASLIDFRFISNLIDDHVSGQSGAAQRRVARVRAAHQKYGVSEEMFFNFTKVLVDELQDKLATGVMNQGIVDLWHKLFKLIGGAIYPL